MERHIVEGVTQEMRDNLERKFAQWSRIVANNTLQQGTGREKQQALQLLRDPSIYAYAFFRNTDGAPFKVYPYQDVILNDPHNRVIFAASNQMGKSICLCIMALHYALNNPGKTVLMVSKTLPQSKDLLRHIRLLLQNSSLDWKYDIGDTDTKTEIYFKHYDFEDPDNPSGITELNQSRIICVPATEGALGYAVDLALVDELAFYENGDDFYKRILQPRTYSTRGKIVVFSNPNGSQGVFYELWNDERFHHYRFNCFDKEGYTQEMFKFDSSSLTQEQVDSTLLSVFSTPFGGFLSAQERSAIQHRRANAVPIIITSPLYVFFDFAKSQDRTVRAVGQMVGTEDMPGAYVHELKEYPSRTPYDEIVGDLMALIEQVGFGNVAMVGWDNTGVGAGVEDFIKHISGLGIMCAPVDFNLANKSRIYTLFKLLAEKTLQGQNRISLPFVPDCDLQLAKLRFTRTARGYLQVHHENEGDRDDFPDAVSGLCSLIIRPDSAPISISILSDGPVLPDSAPDQELTENMMCWHCDYFFKAKEEVCPECNRPRGRS